mgnify:CR=1 FL=1
MKNFKFKIKNVKLAFVILIIALFVVFLLYYHFVFAESFARNDFANQMVEISEANEKSVFNVQKVLLYSSANAIDNSESQALQNMSICQYTDISIYIDNMANASELTDENTIKQLYIDNINITSNSDKGTKLLNYKNPLNFGKYEEIELPQNNRIDFNIVNTNVENENYDYSKPTFYTDCSNPISLGYMNKDILTDYSVSEGTTSVSYNGKVLQEAGISLDELKYTLSFKIHIINNLNEEFVYQMSMDVDLNDENNGMATNGYVYKTQNTQGTQYQFFRVN